MFKALNDLAPDYLCSIFTEGIQSNNLTRHTTNLFTVPLQRTNYLKRASAMEVLISGPTCPVILRETKSLNQFEKAAKSSFWQSQMESSCGNIFFTSIIIENDH